MEVKKTTSKKSRLLNTAVLLLTLFLAYKFLISPITQEVKIIEASAQVLSVDSKYFGMGTASKSWDEKHTAFNVTAFLEKPKSDQFYYAYLKGDGTSAMPDISLGKMELAGDVYSVNYIVNKNIFEYKDLFITLETEAEAGTGKIENPVLSGSFSK